MNPGWGSINYCFKFYTSRKHRLFKAGGQFFAQLSTQLIPRMIQVVFGINERDLVIDLVAPVASRCINSET